MIKPESPVSTIPLKCEGCGIQCEANTKLERLLAIQGFMKSLGESLMGPEGAELDEMIDDSVPPEVAESVKKQFRMDVGEDLNTIDERTALLEDEIKANSLSCEGVLKMRASRGDVTYTVAVCTSPRAYVRDSGPEHLPVHIEASSRDEHR